MLAIIAVLVIGAVLASVLVIAASMLSSRLSRAEDRFLADEPQSELPIPEVLVGDASQSAQ